MTKSLLTAIAIAALMLQALPAAAQVLTPNDNWQRFDPRYSTPGFSNNTVRTPHGSYNCRVYNNGMTECW